MVLGLLGLVAVLVLAFTRNSGFESLFQAYLIAYLYWFGFSLGGLALMFLQYIAGGPWGAISQRFTEAAGHPNMFLALAVLFLPILIGMPVLYPWMDAGYVADHPTVAAKTLYLNMPFFILRTVIYFAIWYLLARHFKRLSKRQQEGEDVAQQLRNNAAPSLIVYVLTMTFAAFDWTMSLTPEWFSGIYGVIVMIGQLIGIIALIIMLLVALGDVDPLPRVLNRVRLQDFGNFLMAFTMFWAYVQFSQLIIIWSNNIVETNTWYVDRFAPGWNWISGFLLVFHFFVPFVILFSRWVKQQGRALVWVAAWMLFAHFIDIVWIILPSLGVAALPLVLISVAFTLLLGGIWLTLFFNNLKGKEIVPLNDPRLAGDLRGASAHG